MWKHKFGSRATYGSLIEVFERVGAMNSADVIRKMISKLYNYCHVMAIVY